MPQNTWHIGFGINPGVPPPEVFEYSLGGEIRVQKDISPRTALMLTTGFTHFFEKDHFDGYPGYGSPYNVIPAKLGIKYFVSNTVYVAGEAGAGFAFEEWGHTFLWSPSVGMAFKNGLDLSLKYEDYVKDRNTKTIAIRLGYNISARKLAPHQKNNAVQAWQLAAGIDAGPAEFNSYAFGGWLNLHKPLTSNLEATISAGYTHYTKQILINVPPFYSGNNIAQTAGHVIPVKAGLNVFLSNRFYLGGAAGAGFAPGVTSFMYTPALGLRFNKLDVALKYDKHSNTNHRIPDMMGLKLGYHFKL